MTSVAVRIGGSDFERGRRVLLGGLWDGERGGGAHENEQREGFR